MLITNCWLADRGGTELYVRDLALGLQRAGYRPMVWSPIVGEVADDLRASGVPVFDDLEAVTPVPDMIHAHHGDETRAALSRFPDIPGIYVQHDAEAWQDEPPRHPRLLRWGAVDELCRERLVTAGIDPDRILVVPNSVDLDRFARRPPLPERPRRALMFSNTAREDGYVPVVREACERTGIDLDVAGIGVAAVVRPEAVLDRYDVVFGKGRSALEALAVGCAVVVLDLRGMAGMVTSDQLTEWRRWNLGRRLLTRTHDTARLQEELARYDPCDAARCTDLVRSEAGLDGMVATLVTHYSSVLDEWRDFGPCDPRADLAAAAGRLATIGPLRLGVLRRDAQLAGIGARAGDLEQEAILLRQRTEVLHAEVVRVTSDATALRGALDDILGGRTMRLRNAVVHSRLLRALRVALHRLPAVRP
jgi:hypothetical protein